MKDYARLHALAEFLCDRREQITSEWLEAVRKERRIRSDEGLPREDLMDHLPRLFDRLTDQLRAVKAGEQGEQAARDAQAHGEHRWQQQYRLDELLREISILRLVFMRHLFDFQAAHPNFVGEPEAEAMRIVHSYFDSMAMDSTAQFVARQQQQLQSANESLAQATARVEAFNERLLEQDERRLRTLRTISHEVRNHLNAISVVVTILTKEQNPAVCHEYLEMLSRNLMDIGSLTNELLDFAGLLSGSERPTFVTCDPAVIYDELMLFVHEMARTKGLGFSATMDPAIGQIITDRQKVHRVALNLLTNAIKYTAQGDVQFGFVSVDEDTWMIEVSDTGPGIPPEERERIFEEFHRIAATTGGQAGAGLGLAITRELVALLGGRIELESEVGRGTTFRVFLPKKRRRIESSAATIDGDDVGGGMPAHGLA